MGRLKDIKVFAELETLARRWVDVDRALSCFSPAERLEKRHFVEELAIEYIGKETGNDVQEITRYSIYYEATKTALLRGIPRPT